MLDAVDGRPLAELAALLADRTRASICLALLDGRAWTAGELARLAGVAAPTATEHLNRLVAGGLLTEVRQGRHRYLRLAGPRVAHLVEELSTYSAMPPPPPSLRGVSGRAALVAARTCYDHLAGRLGVALLDAVTDRGLLDRSAGAVFTPAGLAWLADLGVDPVAPPPGRRPLIRLCLDWTERREHLAGTAGAALCAHFLAAGWIERGPRGRMVRITPAGERGLRDQYGIEPDLPAGGAPAA
jgi:DNA-binding transcriptional ArsR family regulator